MIRDLDLMEPSSLADYRRVDPNKKEHQIAENMLGKLLSRNLEMFNLALELSPEIENLQNDAKEKAAEFRRLVDLSETVNLDEDREYVETDDEDLSERINITKEAANLAFERLENRLRDTDLLDWLNSLFGVSIIRKRILVDMDDNYDTATLKLILTDGHRSTTFLQYGRSLIFSGALGLYEDFGVTNLRPSIFNSDRLIQYLLLLGYFDYSKTASKKANIIIDKLRKLESHPVNMNNSEELNFLSLGVNDRFYQGIKTELRDSINEVVSQQRDAAELNTTPGRNYYHFNNAMQNQGKLEQFTTGPLCVADKDNLRDGLPTKESIDLVWKRIHKFIEDLKETDDYTSRVNLYRKTSADMTDSYGNRNDIRALSVNGIRLATTVYGIRFQNIYLLAALGYENYTRFLDYCINNEIDIHSFLDNITTGVKSNLWKKEEQVAFFKYLKKLGKKQATVIPSYMGYFGYTKAREAKNTMELDAYIAKVTEARRGNVSGQTGMNELLLERVEGNQLIFFTKEEGEIITIGNRTGCCFTPSGLAKSLLGIARKSHLAGILEGRHGDRTKSDWFSFVWELVEYNKETNTIETALVLDNIESMNRISWSDWVDIYKWLLKTPYNKVYLGTSRNDISSEIFSQNADPTDLQDPHIHPDYANRSRQIIRYEKAFNSYSYDDSRTVHIVFDRTKRAPRNLAVARVETLGEFDRVLYAESLVWGTNSDYNVLRDLDFTQSPTYLTRDSLGNIYGYLITRLYKYNTETETIDYNDKFKVKKNEPSGENEELVLYLDDVFATKNMASLKALDSMVKNLLIYTQKNGIKYVSAHFNSYSRKFLKRIEKAGLVYVPDTRFSDSGTDAKLEPKPSLLLQGHPERITVRELNLDEEPNILYPDPVEEEVTSEAESA